jgi:hypothetical protein
MAATGSPRDSATSQRRWLPREEQEDEHVQIAQVTPRGTFDMRHLFNGLRSPDMLRV